MGLAFFGLTSNNIPQSRAAIFTQIHEIVFYGNGGYDWYSVYNMPIWLRRFTHSKINEHYTKEKEQIESQQNGGKGSKTLVDPSGKVNVPEFLSASPKKPAKYK